jgi:hypothetical protein
MGPDKDMTGAIKQPAGGARDPAHQHNRNDVEERRDRVFFRPQAPALLSLSRRAAVMGFALKTPPLIVGAVLLFGCIAVLADSVRRTKWK